MRKSRQRPFHSPVVLTTQQTGPPRPGMQIGEHPAVERHQLAVGKAKATAAADSSTVGATVSGAEEVVHLFAPLDDTWYSVRVLSTNVTVVLVELDEPVP